MKKTRSARRIAAAAACALALAAACLLGLRPDRARAETMAGMDRVTAAMPEEWTETGRAEGEIASLVFSDGREGEIVYYICKTTCLGGELPEPEGLAEILAQVIDPASAESARSCTVGGLDAVLYQKGARAYLCWTASPEYSFALEYDPLTTEEAKIFQMAESVPGER